MKTWCENRKAMPFSIENRAGLAASEFLAIEAEAASHRSVKDAVDWMARCEPPMVAAGIVAQDEFSHDFLFQHANGAWLVYDLT